MFHLRRLARARRPCTCRRGLVLASPRIVSPLFRSASSIGFWAGLAAFSATVSYDVVQLLQLVGFLHFPWDEILIYGTSLGIVVPFVFAIVALHHETSPEKQLWTQAALVFTSMYAVFATANYVIQLTTVIPAKLRGAAAAVEVLDQTPHSLCWDFDAIAYISMGMAASAIIPALDGSAVERRLRAAAKAHAAATILAGVVYFWPSYSTKLLLLGFPWAVTAPLFSLLLARALRARGTSAGSTKSKTPGARRSGALQSLREDYQR